MNQLLCLLVPALLAGCSTPSGTPENAPPAKDDPAMEPLAGAKHFQRWELPNLDDNVRHDTLLVYTTHAVGNGTFLMAARNVEDTREGLRLFLYRPRPDSSAEVLAVSKPAYDSDVMLPTFFTTGDTSDGLVVLANYGSWDSWGQNAFVLKDRQFKDLGWLDVAERVWENRLDSVQQRRLNIAPKTIVTGKNGQFEFTFATDSVQLYDDLEGGIEVMLPSIRVRYRFTGLDMRLLVDGHARIPKEGL